MQRTYSSPPSQKPLNKPNLPSSLNLCYWSKIYTIQPNPLPLTVPISLPPNAPVPNLVSLKILGEKNTL